jgi:hypothetical protein
MRTKIWLMAAIVPVGLLVVSSTASAAVVDCTNATVVCNTFLKGSSKFKPVLSNVACPAGTSETIAIKGTISDCTVSGAPGVKILSGSVKGTIITGDCTCGGLNPGDHAITSGSLTTSWKYDSTATSTCDPNVPAGSKASVLNAGANIHAAIQIAPAPYSGAVYGQFALSGTGVSVTGPFQGGDGGASSVTVGTSTESASTLIGNCLGPKGLKVLTFGQAQTQLQ